ncbi:MAG: DUF3105 domain-containing protein [bacterium]|nr:DUF3105 domain-containing protein [bacterium]
MSRKRITILVIVLLTGLGIFWFIKSPSEKPGEAVPIQPNEVIKPGEPLPGIYLTSPPVSGWHYADKANWGVYTEELPDQTLIANLVAGGVWISYHPDAPPEIIDSLKNIVAKYKTGVVLTPRTNNDKLIALTAWGRLDKFDYYDEARILKFIKVYK